MGNECKLPAAVFISELLSESGREYLILDGGLGTELEFHGADINHPLWSAKCLLDSPHLIQTVHLDYLNAGASIITSASYQATIQGFESHGLSSTKAEALLRRSVEIAREAREIYYNRCTEGCLDDTENAKRPILVAASIGSYGAYLADGSEYSGNYGEAVTMQTLKDFHRRRIQVLAESGADLLAFETIPNKIEAKAFCELLKEEGIKIPAWLSFSSKDGINVSSGDSLTECAAIANSCNNVAAVGFNCTSPRYIHGLILSLRKVSDKPIIIYPNSGETYDGIRKVWVKSNGDDVDSFVPYVRKWLEIGASVIGGCCRTTPSTIRAIANALSHTTSHPN